MPQLRSIIRRPRLATLMSVAARSVSAPARSVSILPARSSDWHNATLRPGFASTHLGHGPQRGRDVRLGLAHLAHQVYRPRILARHKRALTTPRPPSGAQIPLRTPVLAGLA
jgi:hypothetical protein